MIPSAPEIGPNVLSAEEEVTLRRVAYGQSEVRALRAQDLARLRTLRLIENSKNGPQLTATGKRRFDALPRPAAQLGSRQFDSAITQMIGLLDNTRR